MIYHSIDLLYTICYNIMYSQHSILLIKKEYYVYLFSIHRWLRLDQVVLSITTFQALVTVYVKIHHSEDAFALTC